MAYFVWFWYAPWFLMSLVYYSCSVGNLCALDQVENEDDFAFFTLERDLL
jgi:hypothetical protein